ncbi:MAG: hypothetical protein ABJE95_14625 [Byssovorax sp.]
MFCLVTVTVTSSCGASGVPPQLPSAATARPARPAPPASSAGAGERLLPALPVADPLQVELDAIEQRGSTPLLSADGKFILQTGSSTSDDVPGRWTWLSVMDITGATKGRSVSALGDGDVVIKRARLAEMRAILDERVWSPMTTYEMAEDTTVQPRLHGLGMSQPMVGHGEGLTVMFHEPVLIVSDESGRELVRRSYPAWSPRIYRFGHYCSMLTDLVNVSGSRARGLLLVSIHSSGSPEFCVSTGDMQVVRFSPR